MHKGSHLLSMSIVVNYFRNFVPNQFHFKFISVPSFLRRYLANHLSIILTININNSGKILKLDPSRISLKLVLLFEHKAKTDIAIKESSLTL